MVLVRFGKERESTTWSSEEYKDSIRKYMETEGFSMSHNSFTDGTQVDMIFEPFLETGRRAWVEAKNAEIGVNDPDFQREVVGYLATWLQMPPRDRFEFRLFIRKMSGAKNWDKLFGGKSSPNDIIEWIKKALKTCDNPVVSEAIQSKQIDVINFFSTVYAYEGDKWIIDSVREEKEDTSALGTRRLAEREDKEMMKRCQLGTKRATYVSNLVPLTIPRYFFLMKVEEGSMEEIRDRLKGIHLPPFVITGSEILTLDLPDHLDLFSPAKVQDARRVPKEKLEIAYEYELTRLLNICISRIITNKGGLRKEDERRYVFYFPINDGSNGLEPFTIPSSSGRDVTISSPITKRPDSSTEEGLSSSASVGKLNHCFHKGLDARIARYWDKYFILIKLRRVFTSNGYEPIEGDHASRLDAKYRTPNYNRGEAQLSVLNAYAHFLFSQRSRDKNSPIWIDQFKFDKTLSIESDHSPVLIEVGQSTLDMLDEEDDVLED
jgi:hypothetical protein